MKVLRKTLNDIKEEIRYRFYPRQLILLSDENNDNPFKYLVRQCLMILNKYGYYSRFLTINLDENYSVKLDELNYPKGINGVNCVIKLYLTSDFYGIYNAYTVILGNVPFHYAISQNNDLFLEFLYTSKLLDDLRAKYRNMINFIVIDNKLMVDRKVYKNLGREFLMEYIGRFDVDGVEWSFFDIEYTFLIDLIEAYVMYREGLAQSELSFAGDLSGNYEIYLEKGSEKIKEIIENFVSGAVRSKVVRVR